MVPGSWFLVPGGSGFECEIWWSGFTAFGKVIKGMDVVREIHRQPAEGQYLNPHIRILEISIQ